MSDPTAPASEAARLLEAVLLHQVSGFGFKIGAMPSVPATTITPARRVQGTLRVPGDKSISHRYALIAAVAEGISRLSNYAPGADCQSTLACLGSLGIEIQRGENGAVTVVGRGLRGWSSPTEPLDAGNSGSTMRMLAGMLAAQPFTTQLIGDASLSGRPMRRVIEPLSRMARGSWRSTATPR